MALLAVPEVEQWAHARPLLHAGDCEPVVRTGECRRAKTPHSSTVEGERVMLQVPSTNPRLQAALAHARHRQAVLPVYWATGGRCACGRAECHSPAKHPIPELVPRGVRHATTSRFVIRAWWAY